MLMMLYVALALSSLRMDTNYNDGNNNYSNDYNHNKISVGTYNINIACMTDSNRPRSLCSTTTSTTKTYKACSPRTPSSRSYGSTCYPPLMLQRTTPPLLLPSRALYLQLPSSATLWAPCTLQLRRSTTSTTSKVLCVLININSTLTHQLYSNSSTSTLP